MSSIYVVGDENTILGFSLIGVRGQTVKSPEQAEGALDDAVGREGVKIILVTENWAADLREKMDRLKMSGAEPLVLSIPSAEPAAEGRSLRELVEEAVGIRLGGGSGR